jgi:dihydrofolate synthase/folylpolyglutamate synthase
MLRTANDVWEWLATNTSKTIRPGLERMEHVLAELGNPERRLKVIHIAGTNGKGSVAAMIASVLQEAGYSVGTFISPELDHWSDRIRLDGEGIPESELVRWAERIRPIVEQMEEPPTEFEWWTLIALCYFAYEATPWFTVMETGLGGRLDSTNVVYPLVSVITEISYDHLQYLGTTITEIATEKAGIIKNGVPVVTIATDPLAVEVIGKTAKARGSKCYQLGPDFSVHAKKRDREGQSFTFTSKLLEVDAQISLKGMHQLANAAAALMTINILCQQYATIVEPQHLKQGLAKAQWPGRLEEVATDPLIILDGAHNTLGVQALANAIQTDYTYEKLFVIFAMMKDKEAEMIQSLLPLSDHIVATEVPDQPRSRTAEELKNIILAMNPMQSVEAISSPQRALEAIRAQASKQDLIVIAGSLYVIAAIRRLLKET